ncbi:PROKR2 [Branchiostoma lanceolatum]|uniref:PROKR2 protein n=1 Tax=Branchiostoma lanceolatum TaxID=7740 RepID=A0A8J9ZG51_BRALA|nr:PROKR2 [Branchiostoma lanceolatum]
MGFANATVYLNEENAHFANNSSLENLLLAFDLDELMKAFLELISDNETEADATRNLFGNASPGGPTNSLDGSEIAIGVLYSLIMLVCGVGNFLLLLALLLYKETRTPTNLLIGNLALSDLLVSLLCLPYNMDYHVVHEGSWHHSTALCAVVNFFTSVSHYVSTHALLAIGIDRYLVVQDARTRRFNPRWTSVVIWVVALVLALPGAIFSRTVPYQREDSVFCGVLWPVSLQHVYKGFHIFLVVCEFAVPAVIMSVFYSFVVCKVWRRQFPGQHNASHARAQSRSRRKSIRLFALFIMFVLCWTPYHIYSILRDFYIGILAKISTSLNLFYMVQAIAMSNSLMNTLVYVVFNDNITRFLKTLPRDLFISLQKNYRNKSSQMHRQHESRQRVDYMTSMTPRTARSTLAVNTREHIHSSRVSHENSINRMEMVSCV